MARQHPLEAFRLLATPSACFIASFFFSLPTTVKRARWFFIIDALNMIQKHQCHELERIIKSQSKGSFIADQFISK